MHFCAFVLIYYIIIIIIIIIIFLLSQENGQASRGSNDIPTRLAPCRTPILCRQTQRKVLLKKRGKKEGGLGQNPQTQTRNKAEKNRRKEKTGNNSLRDPRAREPTPVQEEFSLKTLRQHRKPNRALCRVTQISQQICTTISFPKDVRGNDLYTLVTSVMPTVTEQNWNRGAIFKDQQSTR